MKKIVPLAILGYLLILVFQFPATPAIALLSKIEPDLKLSGIEGSLWNGSAQQLTYQEQHLGQINWEHNLVSMFSGSLGSKLQIKGEIDFIGTIEQSLTGKTFIKKAKVLTSIKRLLRQLSLPIQLPATGTLRASINNMEIEQRRLMAAEADLYLKDLRIFEKGLGDFSGVITDGDQPDEILLSINSEKNAVITLDGTVRLNYIPESAQQHYAINIYLEKPEVLGSIVTGYIKSKAKREGKGYRLTLEGVF